MSDRMFSLLPYSSAVTLLAGMGINVDAVARQAGLPHGLLGDPKGLVTARQFHQLVALVRSLFGHDRAFALNIADVVRLDMADLIGPLFATTASVGSYLSEAERFHPLFNPCTDIRIEYVGEEVRVVCGIARGQGVDDRFFHAEATFAVGHRLVQSVFRQPGLSPLRIEMQHDGSGWIDDYRKHFGEQTDVLFLCPENVLVLRREWLDIVNPGHSPEAHGHLMKLAVARLAALPTTEAWSLRVLRYLEQETGRRVLDMANVADYLGVTARTLQRRLAEEKTTFQAVRDGLRFERACALMRDVSCDMATIAATLGFSEPSTFQRAFKSWSGCSPAEYRRRHAGETQSS